MTYRLTATILMKGATQAMTKEFYYSGETKDDVLDQIDTLPFHRNNLKQYGKTAFKDVHGIKHKWVLEPVKTGPSQN